MKNRTILNTDLGQLKFYNPPHRQQGDKIRSKAVTESERNREGNKIIRFREIVDDENILRL